MLRSQLGEPACPISHDVPVKIFDLARWQKWVIRVIIAMSALSSAIHNTGHYHVRPRPLGAGSSAQTAGFGGFSFCNEVVRRAGFEPALLSF
jgi:hypothetical protein